MRRIHFITCSFIEDNNTRQPNDVVVVIIVVVVVVTLNGSSALYFVHSVLSVWFWYVVVGSMCVRSRSLSFSQLFVDAISAVREYFNTKECVSLPQSSDESKPISRLSVLMLNKNNENFTKYSLTAGFSVSLFINSCTIARLKL